ncbi:MAG: O-antigen ligase family protein, partial [Acidobacteriota bacterium]|nr:O-antigen ligase family protein [Acidobacteriota bacterium]
MSRILVILTASLMGMLAIAASIGMADLNFKETILVLAAIGTIPLMALTQHAKAVALVGWILSVTYFRAFYPIDSFAGFQGFFTTASDAFLLALALIWLAEIAAGRRPVAATGSSVWHAAALFLFVCAVSSVMAQRSDWAAYEVARVVKVVFILLFCRFNLDATSWWACVVGFGGAVVAQSAYGIVQVTTRLGRYNLADYESYRRAGGTLGHANLLACYLLLLSPAFLALSLTAGTRMTRALCGAVGLIGIAGVAVTISRGPWLIAVIEIAALTVVWLSSGLVRLKAAIGVFVVTIVVLGLALVPFSGWIESRMRRDVKESVDFRLMLNEVAFDVFRQHPFFGIGLNNFPLYLLSYDMPFHDSLARALAQRQERSSDPEQINGLAAGDSGSRWMWVPHNLYFLLLAETGIFGLAAFLLFIGSSVSVALKATALSGAWGGLSVGFLIGMCGVLGYMLIDFAMWLDPVLYAFTMVVGLLSAAPAIAGSERGRNGRLSGSTSFRRSRVAYAAVPFLLTIACASPGQAEADRRNGSEELSAAVNVDTVKILKTIPRELYGANVDWVYDAGGLWDSNKAAFRPDMLDAVEKLRPGALLFPAGISADFYHWRDGVGPQTSRPIRSHGSDNDTSNNRFGTDEFLTLCRRTGASPALLVNVLTGSPSEAAEWVAYCKSNVRNWIIGNEPYMKGYSDAQKRGYMPAAQFADRFLTYADAMRKADPGIRLLAPAGQNFGRYGVVDDKNWDKVLLERAGSQIDYLSVHNAYSPVVSQNASFEEVYKAMFSFPEHLRANLKTLNRHIDSYAPAHAKRIKIAITEWGPFFVPSGKEHYLGHTKTLGSALYVASALQVFLEADRVEMADFFKLTDPAFQGLI